MWRRAATAAAFAAAAAAGAARGNPVAERPHIVRAAVFGQGGVAEGAKPPGTLIIDMSSIDPEPPDESTGGGCCVLKGLALGGQPAVGRHPQGRDGRTDPDAGRHRWRLWLEAQAILSQVASNQTRMGGPGAGQTTKLINQVLCGLGFLAVAEATALAEAAGWMPTMIPRR